MKKKGKVAAFLLSVMAADASIAADNIQLSGVWKEKDGTAVYSFLRDHEFEYRYAYPNRDQEHKKGAWQTGADMCWVEEGGVKGNLMIHLGTERCCHIAYFLGKNLVLNSIAKPRYGGVCDARVLTKDSDKQ